MWGGLLLCIVVIDTRVRPRVTRFLEPIGKALAAVGVTPTVMTAIGLGLVIVGSIVIASDALRTGAVIVLVGSLLDGLDGSIARASDSVTARGAFLDSVFDRMGEIAAFAGLGVAFAQILGYVEPMLWIYVVLVWITALMRFIHTYRSFE
jgi:phosphatidylglycerophosphate synthase